MKINTLKKGIVSLALAGSFVLGIGATSNAQAQSWRRTQELRRREWQLDRQVDRLERQEAQAELQRIRQLDRQRRVRYQSWSNNRIVGYYDRAGRFHATGYYDRAGNFFRYR